jgi:hypothetical protein
VTFIASACDVARVGFLEQRGIALDTRRHRREGGVLRSRRRPRHRTRCPARAPAEVGHVRVDIHGDSRIAGHADARRAG